MEAFPPVILAAIFSVPLNRITPIGHYDAVALGARTTVPLTVCLRPLDPVVARSDSGFLFTLDGGPGWRQGRGRA